MIQRKFFEKETELSYTTLEHLTNQAKVMEKKDICYFGAKCCLKTTEKKSWTIEELYDETFSK
jgi:hypothetical protein